MILKNKTILVTGVGKGIGKAICMNALKEGAFVYGITRSSSDIDKNFKNFHVKKNSYTNMPDILNKMGLNKVNGILLEINSKNGDSVEILTSNTQKPSYAWLKFVQTGKAKSHVKRWVKKEQTEKERCLLT